MADRQGDRACVVAVAGDPAGAACLAPVMKAIATSTDMELKAYAYKQARQMWQDRGLSFTELTESTDTAAAAEILRVHHADVLLTATSANGVDLEKHFINAAQCSDVP